MTRRGDRPTSTGSLGLEETGVLACKELNNLPSLTIRWTMALSEDASTDERHEDDTVRPFNCSRDGCTESLNSREIRYMVGGDVYCSNKCAQPARRQA